MLLCLRGPSAGRAAALARPAARAVLRDAATAVELHVAAVEQQRPQLRPAALHARLRAGHRDPEPPRRLDLATNPRTRSAPAPRADSQAACRRADASRRPAPAAASRTRIPRAACRRAAPDRRPHRPAARSRRSATVVVDDRVASDPMHPRREPVGIGQLIAVPVDAQHHVLQHVLGVLGVGDPPRDQTRRAAHAARAKRRRDRRRPSAAAPARRCTRGEHPREVVRQRVLARRRVRARAPGVELGEHCVDDQRDRRLGVVLPAVAPDAARRPRRAPAPVRTALALTDVRTRCRAR